MWDDAPLNIRTVCRAARRWRTTRRPNLPLRQARADLLWELLLSLPTSVPRVTSPFPERRRAAAA